MSGGASKLRDVRKLADSRAVFELDLPLGQLPGLPSEFSSGGGMLHACLSFGREQGFALARVALQSVLAVTCQRCLGPMQLRVNVSSPVLIVESGQQAEDAPAGWETFLAPEGRVDFAALAAEELLLALPFVPLHEDMAQCQPLVQPQTQAPLGAPGAPGALGGSVESASAAAPEQAMARPFADLRALLERDAATRK